MKIETDNYMRAKNFAKREGVTTMSVYRWIKIGVVKSIEIDGVKFVKVNPDAKR